MPGGDIIGINAELNVHAFVKSAVLGSGDEQVVSAIVTNQAGLPLAGATVTLMLEGETTGTVGMTSDNGICQFSFRAPPQTPGLHTLTVKVIFEEREQETTTSYRVWW